MSNQSKKLSDLHLLALTPHETEETLGGTYVRTRKRASQPPTSSVLAALGGVYVPQVPPPGTVFTYGSYYPIYTGPF